MTRPTARSTVFRALIGDFPPREGDTDPNGAVSLFEGLAWSVEVDRGLARLAGCARLAIGTDRSWADVEWLVEYALIELNRAAEAAAARERRRIEEVLRIVPGAPKGNVTEAEISTDLYAASHGWASLLVEALIWSTLDDHFVVHPVVPHGAVTGATTVAAFALHMFDLAAYEAARRRHALASRHVCEGSYALAFATMDAANVQAARVQHLRSEQDRSEKARSGGLKRGAKLHPVKERLRQEYLVGLSKGKFKSANHAAGQLVGLALELAKQAGSPLSADRAQKTVADWLKRFEAGEDSQD